MSVREEVQAITENKLVKVYRCDLCENDIVDNNFFEIKKITTFFAATRHLCLKCNNNAYDEIFKKGE